MKQVAAGYYNNNGNRNRWNGGGRNDNRGSGRELPAEIKPEQIPEDYVEQAEKVMRNVMGQRGAITTSKIRNLLSMVSDIYNEENIRTETELLPGNVSALMMMRVRTVYECGRDDTVKRFVQETRLLQYLKGIGSSRTELIRFAHYMEALVAYHRYFGGKEN